MRRNALRSLRQGLLLRGNLRIDSSDWDALVVPLKDEICALLLEGLDLLLDAFDPSRVAHARRSVDRLSERSPLSFYCTKIRADGGDLGLYVENLGLYLLRGIIQLFFFSGN